VRRLAEHNTGNYAIELVDLGTTGEEYVLRVRYLGKWASGEDVDLYSIDLVDALDAELGDEWGEPEVLEEADAIALEWFEAIRGDLDVAGYLANNGYDRYANR